MRKALFAISCGALLCSCGGGGSSSTGQTKYQSFTITFVSNGGTEVGPLQVEYGEKAAKPADPSKGGDEFLGWFVDAVCVTPFDWDTQITSDWTPPRLSPSRPRSPSTSATPAGGTSTPP